MIPQRLVGRPTAPEMRERADRKSLAAPGDGLDDALGRVLGHDLLRCPLVHEDPHHGLKHGNLILGVSQKAEAPKPLGTYAYVLDVTTTASAGNTIYVVKALINAEIKTIIVKAAGVEGTPVVGNVYEYSLLAKDNEELGLKKGDVVLANGTKVTLKSWDKKDFDATKLSDKVVVVYNKDLDTVIDATKLIAKDGVVTLEGEEIYEGALSYYEGAEYIFIQYATK